MDGPLASDCIYNMDCMDGMRSVARSSVDLIITDPPFAIDFGPKRSNYNRTSSRVLDGYGEVESRNYYAFTKRWMALAFDALKESGSMYVFSGWNNLSDVLNAINDVKLEVVNHIIWKYQFGVVTTRRYVSSHYHCLFVCKNDSERKFYPYSRFAKEDRTLDGRSLHYRDKEDVWEIKREYWRGSKKTPTKLPAELIRKILAYSSDKNDTVMDPFLGSGQVAVVAKSEGRKYLGFEIVPEYYKFAKRRLAEDRYLIDADGPAAYSDEQKSLQPSD